MAKVSNPRRFSEAFGINPVVLKERGAFDPILNADTLLFVDPLLLDVSRHPEMQEASTAWTQHFEDVITLLQSATARGDLPWRQA